MAVIPENNSSNLTLPTPDNIISYTVLDWRKLSMCMYLLLIGAGLPPAGGYSGLIHFAHKSSLSRTYCLTVLSGADLTRTVTAAGNNTDERVPHHTLCRFITRNNPPPHRCCKMGNSLWFQESWQNTHGVLLNGIPVCTGNFFFIYWQSPW